jgi:hypothetical protein
MEIHDGSGWNTHCNSGACIRGYYDVSDASGSGVPIQGFKFTTEEKDKKAGICHIWIYEFENWARTSKGTTLTYWIYESNKMKISPNDWIDDSPGAIEQVNSRDYTMDGYKNSV